MGSTSNSKPWRTDGRNQNDVKGRNDGHSSAETEASSKRSINIEKIQSRNITVIKRSQNVFQAVNLPKVLNLNPRSAMNKTEQIKVFIEEEEQNIARIALEKKDDGKDLTWSNLKEIMIEEMEMIKLKDPSRDMCKVSSTQGSLLSSPFVRRYAKRNGLSK